LVVAPCEWTAFFVLFLVRLVEWRVALCLVFGEEAPEEKRLEWRVRWWVAFRGAASAIDASVNAATSARTSVVNVFRTIGVILPARRTSRSGARTGSSQQ